MIRENPMLLTDPVPFDEDYYVIDEPPSAELRHPDPTDDRAAREPMLQLATVTPAPRFSVYWSAPIELDLDWADED